MQLELKLTQLDLNSIFEHNIFSFMFGNINVIEISNELSLVELNHIEFKLVESNLISIPFKSNWISIPFESNWI